MHVVMTKSDGTLCADVLPEWLTIASDNKVDISPKNEETVKKF
jgi:hypothetical protein